MSQILAICENGLAGSHLILERQATEVPQDYFDITFLHTKLFIPSDSCVSLHHLQDKSSFWINTQEVSHSKSLETKKKVEFSSDYDSEH